jgi:hypothetical protein
MHMPPREVQGPVYYDEDGQIQEGGWTLVYQPFTTTGLLNGKLILPPSWKDLRL